MLLASSGLSGGRELWGWGVGQGNWSPLQGTRGKPSALDSSCVTDQPSLSAFITNSQDVEVQG